MKLNDINNTLAQLCQIYFPGFISIIAQPLTHGIYVGIFTYI